MSHVLLNVVEAVTASARSSLGLVRGRACACRSSSRCTTHLEVTRSALMPLPGGPGCFVLEELRTTRVGVSCVKLCGAFRHPVYTQDTVFELAVVVV